MIDPTRLLEINVALDRLDQTRPRRALAFECHFFGGLTRTEIAAIDGISDKAAADHIRLAKARLSSELAPARSAHCFLTRPAKINKFSKVSLRLREAAPPQLMK